MKLPLLGILLAAGVAASAHAAAPRPNIVFLLADDLGSRDVGWRGSDIRTPNLDQLARDGARLEQFYVQPLCSPTRAALLTGRYPCRYGLQVGVVRPWAQYGLPLEERTLASALKEAGYQTAIVGKWHLGFIREEYLPTRRGFDHQYGHYNGAIDYFTHLRDGGHDWNRDDQPNDDKGYSTHLIADEAVRLIEKREPAKPFFLYVPFNGVHAPLEVPDSYAAPYTQYEGNRRTYAGMTTAVDEAVGKIVAALREQGLAEKTLIVFASDNGGPNPGRLSDNSPFRAGKGSVYEGGVRSCALAYWPGQIKPGTVVQAPLHVVDWYPTLLKLAGADLQQKLPLDGLDAWPAIADGAPSPHDAILLNAAPRGGALRVGDWKLVLKELAGDPDANSAGKEDSADDASPAAATTLKAELYDLADDPGEKHDLAANKPGVVRDLRARYDAFARQAARPKGGPKPANFKVPAIWGPQ